MAVNFPSSLDSFTNPVGTDLLENSNAALDHDVQHSNANDAIEALEAKVGVNSSAVTTSHDYKLSGVTGSDKAVSKTGTETLTNKTLTSPTITGGTVTGVTATTTSVNSVTLSTGEGTTKFLRGDGTYQIPTAGDASYAAKGSVQGLTDAATSGLTIASGVISVNDGTTANKILKLNSSAQIPAVDGSLLTKISPDIKNGTTTYDLATASGTQTIAHGLGRTPKFVRMNYILSTTSQVAIPVNNGAGYGVYNGTTYSVQYVGTKSGDTAGQYATYQGTSHIIRYERGGGGSEVSQVATVTLDSTNITLDWTKTNSPTGTLLILWEAM